VKNEEGVIVVKQREGGGDCETEEGEESDRRCDRAV